MDVLRGFNRVFVVLYILWAVYCLVLFPIQVRHDMFQSYVEARSKCYENSSAFLAKDCVEMWDKILLPDIAQWSLPNYYKTKWGYMLAAVTVVPAVVYGLLRLIGIAGIWVFLGFKNQG